MYDVSALRRHTDFVFLIKAQVTRKRTNLHWSFFMYNGRTSVWKLTAILNLLKIRTSIDIFSTEK